MGRPAHAQEIAYQFFTIPDAAHRRDYTLRIHNDGTWSSSMSETTYGGQQGLSACFSGRNGRFCGYVPNIQWLPGSSNTLSGQLSSSEMAQIQQVIPTSGDYRPSERPNQYPNTVWVLGVKAQFRDGDGVKILSFVPWAAADYNALKAPYDPTLLDNGNGTLQLEEYPIELLNRLTPLALTGRFPETLRATGIIITLPGG
jgi:hypothetical protein